MWWHVITDRDNIYVTTRMWWHPPNKPRSTQFNTRYFLLSIQTPRSFTKSLHFWYAETYFSFNDIYQLNEYSWFPLLTSVVHQKRNTLKLVPEPAVHKTQLLNPILSETHTVPTLQVILPYLHLNGILLLEFSDRKSIISHRSTNAFKPTVKLISLSVNCHIHNGSCRRKVTTRIDVQGVLW